MRNLAIVIVFPIFWMALGAPSRAQPSDSKSKKYSISQFNIPVMYGGVGPDVKQEEVPESIVAELKQRTSSAGVGDAQALNAAFGLPLTPAQRGRVMRHIIKTFCITTNQKKSVDANYAFYVVLAVGYLTREPGEIRDLLPFLLSIAKHTEKESVLREYVFECLMKASPKNSQVLDLAISCLDDGKPEIQSLAIAYLGKV